MKDYKINFYIADSLIEAIGLKESILLSELLGYQRMYYDGGMAGNGFFPCSIEEMKSRTNISGQQQWRIIKKLEALGLIKSEISGKGMGWLESRSFFVTNECQEIMNRLMRKGSRMTDSSSSPKQGNKLKTIVR